MGSISLEKAIGYLNSVYVSHRDDMRLTAPVRGSLHQGNKAVLGYVLRGNGIRERHGSSDLQRLGEIPRSIGIRGYVVTQRRGERTGKGEGTWEGKSRW